MSSQSNREKMENRPRSEHRAVISYPFINLNVFYSSFIIDYHNTN